MRVFFGACLSSLRIDSSIYRFLNSIHKDTADSPFNDSCRVQEWDSAHSFANIDADERQSSQMQINTLLTITRTQTCSRNESCLFCSSSLSRLVSPAFLNHLCYRCPPIAACFYDNMENRLVLKCVRAHFKL